MDWLAEGRTRANLRAELRAGRLISPRLGMLQVVDDADASVRHRRRVFATAPFLGPATFFSHASAAVLHGLPMLATRLTEVAVVRTGGGHGAINPTLHARRAVLGDDEVAVVEGLPVTSLARTVRDLVRTLPFVEGVMVADAALARGLDRGGLLSGTSTGRGCRLAARALLFADPRAESAGESISRVRIWQAGLPMPELQQAFYDDQGNFLGRGDFWWRHFKVIGEFDGAVKYGRLLKQGGTTDKVVMAEKRREHALENQGYSVVRWTWDELPRSLFIPRLRRELKSD